MVAKLKLSEIDFGTTDARTQILSRETDQRQLFFDSFYLPAKFNLQPLVSGRKFILQGPKGSGKTAYLSYLRHTLDQNENSVSRFITFRDDVTDLERDRLLDTSSTTIYDTEDCDGETNDALHSWCIYIHREFARMLQDNRSYYASTPKTNSYIELVNGFFGSLQDQRFKKSLIRLSSGKIGLNFGVFASSGEFQLVDANNNIQVHELHRYLTDCIQDLHISDDHKSARFNLFIDEINLNLLSKKQHRRDKIIIRDLISAATLLNRRFSELNLPFHIYTAIRTEVVNEIESNVREISKWMSDYSISIEWYDDSMSVMEQPIIDL